MKSLIKDYKKKKPLIENRLKDFKAVYEKGDKDIFSELCFCILTPQAKAVVCDKAIKRLLKNDVLLKGTVKDIRPYLAGVRFPNNKAKYLVKVRELFNGHGDIRIKDRINAKDIFKTRDWLVKNVLGMGYKEASHFLRNIGFGKDIAILDRHILKNIKALGIIREIPRSLTKRKYIAIENKMKSFFSKLGIPLDEIDLLFWSKETGYVFK